MKKNLVKSSEEAMIQIKKGLLVFAKYVLSVNTMTKYYKNIIILIKVKKV